MIFSFKFTAWLSLIIGTVNFVLVLSSIIFDVPRIKDQNLGSLELIVFLVMAIFGWLVIKYLRPGRIERLKQSNQFVLWADGLAYAAPSENLRFYGILFFVAVSPIFWLGALDLEARVALFLGGPLLFLLGWLMMWSVLGFHLVNPLVWMWPKFLVFASLLFHFFGILNVLLGATVMPLLDSRPEVVMVSLVSLGSTVAASQFLRFWTKKNGIVRDAKQINASD